MYIGSKRACARKRVCATHSLTRLRFNFSSTLTVFWLLAFIEMNFQPRNTNECVEACGERTAHDDTDHWQNKQMQLLFLLFIAKSKWRCRSKSFIDYLISPVWNCCSILKWLHRKINENCKQLRFKTLMWKSRYEWSEGTATHFALSVLFVFFLSFCKFISKCCRHLKLKLFGLWLVFLHDNSAN